MNTIFLIGAFNGIFLSLLLISKKRKVLQDYILVAMLTLLGLFTGIYGFTRDFLFHEYPLTSVALISLLMLPGPLLYLYLSALAGKKHLKRIDLVHFIPIGLFLLYLILAGTFPSLAKGVTMEHVHYHTAAPFLFSLFLIITALSGPVYFIIAYRLFRKHDINIFNNYSSQKGIDLSWLKSLVLIFGLVWTVLMVIAAIHHIFSLYELSFCTDGLALTLSVFIIWIGWYGLRQKEIFYYQPEEVKESETGATEQPAKYSGSGISSENVLMLAAQLENLMNDKQPYTDPDLTLQLLAGMLNVPSHHLSRTINEHFKMNFFDFINQYRIEEVKKRINDPSFNNLTILGIAMDCGFNSKSAFNRLFKKYTGQTPSEFKSVSPVLFS